MNEKTVELGDRVKDHISGFEGIVTAKTEFLNGCIRFNIGSEKLTDKGELINEHWFDDTQIVIVDKRAYFTANKTEPTVAAVGGPRDHNPARPDAPTR